MGDTYSDIRDQQELLKKIIEKAPVVYKQVASVIKRYRQHKQQRMDITSAINTLIICNKESNGVGAGKVSDGYHTFDELYDHRIQLFIALLAMMRTVEIAKGKPPYTIWKSRKHSDGSEMDGWFIMGIGEVPGTQISYHLPNKYWDEVHFVKERNTAPEWDGHTPADVVERLKKIQ